MKPKYPTKHSALGAFQRIFPPSRRDEIVARALRGKYPRTLPVRVFIDLFLFAFVRLLSGLREIREFYGKSCGVTSLGTFSYALRSKVMLRAAQELCAALPRSPYRAGELLAVDSMAISLPATQRHGCAKMNRHTVGGGVQWMFRLRTPAGETPIEVLKTLAGAWCDSQAVRGVKLAARGPIHLMDRGFYALDLIDQWSKEGVHFILRARGKDLRYESLEGRGQPRRIGSLEVLFDGIARLGVSTRRGPRPVVRLVVCRRPNGEDLILVSDLRGWDAQALLCAYRKRWQIERFHRFMKHTLGLSHLYSFQQRGIEFLLTLAILLAAAVLLREESKRFEGKTPVDRLYRGLRHLRRQWGLRTPWRPNTCTKKWNAKRKPLTP